MDNAPTLNGSTPGSDNAAVAARLVAIEVCLGEIIRYLDELKNLLIVLDGVQPNRQTP